MYPSPSGPTVKVRTIREAFFGNATHPIGEVATCDESVAVLLAFEGVVSILPGQELSPAARAERAKLARRKPWKAPERPMVPMVKVECVGRDWTRPATGGMQTCTFGMLVGSTALTPGDVIEAREDDVASAMIADPKALRLCEGSAFSARALAFIQSHNGEGKPKPY